MVREQIGAVACFKRAVVVKRLPKTRSGKILRATLQKMVNGDVFKIPATIDDPLILDEISESLGLSVPEHIDDDIPEYYLRSVFM